jgi:hypothetical protein
MRDKLTISELLRLRTVLSHDAILVLIYFNEQPSDKVDISFSELARATHIKRRYIGKWLRKLSKMGFVTISNQQYLSNHTMRACVSLNFQEIRAHRDTRLDQRKERATNIIFDACEARRPKRITLRVVVEIVEGICSTPYGHDFLQLLNRGTENGRRRETGRSENDTKAPKIKG